MKSAALLFLCIITIGTFSCSESAIHKKLTSCDSLVIQFNAPNSDSIVNTFQATAGNAISKMAGFVDSRATEEFKCGYDGNLVFYAAGKAQLPVMFKYKEPDCRHFLYEWEGKLRSTRMTKEAADFLETLEKGNSQ